MIYWKKVNLLLCCLTLDFILLTLWKATPPSMLSLSARKISDNYFLGKATFTGCFYGIPSVTQVSNQILKCGVALLNRKTDVMWWPTFSKGPMSKFYCDHFTSVLKIVQITWKLFTLFIIKFCALWHLDVAFLYMDRWWSFAWIFFKDVLMGIPKRDLLGMTVAVSVCQIIKY